MGKTCRVFSSGEALAKELEEYLNKNPELNKKIKQNKKVYFYTTDDSERFCKLGTKFLGQTIKEVSIAIACLSVFLSFDNIISLIISIVWNI